MAESVRVTEIFFSLQGETRTVGLPTAFVRLTGCPLRCSYCDTAYAFSGGERLSFDEIVDRLRSFDARYVTVTGGEPLAQRSCLNLLRRLADEGFSVSLETGGAHDISEVDPRVVRVVDVKTPGSGEVSRNRYQNFEKLRDSDQVKFVITGEEDYSWSVKTMNEFRLAARCEVLFSPVTEVLDPTRLAEWILRDRLPVRFQLQLHKILWGEAPGR
ncbi:MAG TPA: 7-carboxy-7-deazaguanine synthase QueE [Methylococcus sp.]|nr:7-carboxy-7-deazaguanine synthase QueE [Methylococcus sp.]